MISFSHRIISSAIGSAIVLATNSACADESLPNGLDGETSTRVGETLDPSALRILPLYAPEQRGATARSFENLALLLPATQDDVYGVSMAGTTSPENSFFIDGIRVGDPVLGVLLLPLSMEFVERADVSLSGADPVFGRGVGGMYSVRTRSGSNQWHVSTWSSDVPGALESARLPKEFPGTAVEMQSRLANVFDAGASISGPLIKGRLFFFAGGSFATRRYRLDRSLYGLRWGSSNYRLHPQIDPDTGAQAKVHLPGTDSAALAEGTIAQWLGKLSYRVSRSMDVSLSIFGTRTVSGGDGTYHFNSESDALGVTNLNGDYSALARTESALSNAVVLRGTKLFSEDTRLDVALGWVRGEIDSAAADGSGIADIRRAGTWAHVPGVLWDRSSVELGNHDIFDFETLPPQARTQCDTLADSTTDDFEVGCTVPTYRTGGPGSLSNRMTDRLEGHAVISTRVSALGEHRIRAGLDFEQNWAVLKDAFSGIVWLHENATGTQVTNTQYGFLRGPDDGVDLEGIARASASSDFGLFVADTWSIRKNLVVQANLRYDGQFLRGADRAIVLPFMLSPQVGLSWDPTRKGKSRIFAQYAYRYQTLPLNVAGRALSDETELLHVHNVKDCDIKTPERRYGGCGSKTAIPMMNASTSISTLFQVSRQSALVDAQIAPPAAHTLALGAAFTIPLDIRLGANFMHNDMVRTIEDVDTGGELRMIGNPGFGAVARAPRPKRTYDAISLSATRPFANGFVALASYTVSWLRGNYEGFSRAHSTRLDPNMLGDIGFSDTNPYQDWWNLPGDRRHTVKVYGGKAFAVRPDLAIEVGGAYVGRSGTLYYALDPSPKDGANVVVLGSGQLPWVNRLDVRVGLTSRPRKDVQLSGAVEVYNVANGQAEKEAEPTFLLQEEQLNPRYGKPTAYQAPRQVRVSLRMEY